MLHGQKSCPGLLALQTGTGQGVSTSLITNCKGKSEGEQEPPVLGPPGLLAIRHCASWEVQSICPLPCVTALPPFPASCAQAMAVTFLQEEKDPRILHSVDLEVPAAVPPLCRVHHMLAVRELNLVCVCCDTRQTPRALP